MTIEVQASSVAYKGDGGTIEFPTTFSFGADSDLTVTVTSGGVATTKALNVDYVVNGAGAAEPGGSVIFGAPPNNGDTVLVERNTPITQLTDFRTSGPFSAASITRALDKQTRIEQENRRRIEALESGRVTVVLASQNVTKNFTPFADPPESNFPVNVACVGTPAAVFLARVEDLTDGANVHVGLGEADWGSPILNQFTLRYVPGLTPTHNYRLTFVVLT